MRFVPEIVWKIDDLLDDITLDDPKAVMWFSYLRKRCEIHLEYAKRRVSINKDYI
jgi:hypothetical protein